MTHSDRPPRESSDEKRLRILEAARAVCARSGYDAARMEEIAAEARVSKGTLYNFFESKEQLFLATVLGSYEENRGQIAVEIGHLEDPRDRLEALMNAMVESLPKVSDGMTVNFQVWGVVARDDEARAQMCRELRAQYAKNAEQLEAALEAGQRAGVFREDLDRSSVIAGMWAIFDGFIYRSTFDPDHANTEGLRAAFDTLVCQRVLTKPGDSGREALGGPRRVAKEGRRRA